MAKISEELRGLAIRSGTNEVNAIHFKELCQLLAKHFEESTEAPQKLVAKNAKP